MSKKSLKKPKNAENRVFCHSRASARVYFQVFIAEKWPEVENISFR